VPPVCCAKAIGESARTAADAAAIVSVRNMAFLLGWRRVAEISTEIRQMTALPRDESAAAARL
jgi:hypothetical protein